MDECHSQLGQIDCYECQSSPVIESADQCGQLVRELCSRNGIFYAQDSETAGYDFIEFSLNKLAGALNIDAPQLVIQWTTFEVACTQESHPHKDAASWFAFENQKQTHQLLNALRLWQIKNYYSALHYKFRHSGRIMCCNAEYWEAPINSLLYCRFD